MITPRHINQVRDAIHKRGLIEQDFELISNHTGLTIKYNRADFYFTFARRALLPMAPLATSEAIAQAVVSAFLPYSIEYKPSILSQPTDVGPIKNLAKDFGYALNTINRWLAWIKQEYGPFEGNKTLLGEKSTQPTQDTMNEEFIKKQATDAVEVAFRYNIHHEIDKCSAVIINKAERIYKPVDKVLYFEEAIRLINVKISEHRSTCKQGAGCYTEKQHEQIIHFLQQELDVIPVSPKGVDVSTTLATSAAIEKIFISHSSKDSSIVEEVIDLLEIVGVRPEQIFCSSFAGYSIEFGQDFLQRIKDELNGNVLVIFVLSHSFYNSPISLCEMGAAWVQTRQHIPIVVPPLSYDEIRGVIPLTQGFKVNEPLKWNLFKEQLEGWFACKNTASASVWERKRDKAIQSINRQIANTQPIEAAKVTPRRRGGSPSTQII